MGKEVRIGDAPRCFLNYSKPAHRKIFYYRALSLGVAHGCFSFMKRSGGAHSLKKYMIEFFLNLAVEGLPTPRRNWKKWAQVGGLPHHLFNFGVTSLINTIMINPERARPETKTILTHHSI